MLAYCHRTGGPLGSFVKRILRKNLNAFLSGACCQEPAVRPLSRKAEAHLRNVLWRKTSLNVWRGSRPLCFESGEGPGFSERFGERARLRGSRFARLIFLPPRASRD